MTITIVFVIVAIATQLNIIFILRELHVVVALALQLRRVVPGGQEKKNTEGGRVSQLLKRATSVFTSHRTNATNQSNAVDDREETLLSVADEQSRL